MAGRFRGRGRPSRVFAGGHCRVAGKPRETKEAYSLQCSRGRLLENAAYPPGSVISFVDPEHRESAPPLAAVLVTETVSRQSGMWLTVKSLGAETAEEKKKVDGYFKGSRKKVHICCLGPDGICPMDDEDALHLQRFHWFPPGDFTAE